MKARKRAIDGSRYAFWRWTFIAKEVDGIEQLYLKRLRVIQTPLFSIYVHWIERPDEDRHPHDHPWTFWAFIVRGGYVERVGRPPQRNIFFKDMDTRYLRTWKRFSFHKFRRADCHMITEVKPGTISLVFCGRRQKDWFFYTEDGRVQWKKYLDEQGVTAPHSRPVTS